VKWTVELVSILAAPVFGLLGVWLGGWVQAKRDDARLGREEKIAREARAFEYKQATYTDFMQTWRGFYSATFDYVHDLVPGAGPDHDSFEPLYASAQQVGMWGTSEAFAHADQATQLLMAYALKGDGRIDATKAELDATKQLETEMDDAIVAFRRAMRLDLHGRDGA
jgi:hypothetical protein